MAIPDTPKMPTWSRIFRNTDSTLAWDKVIAGFVSMAGLAGGIWSFYYKEIYTPAATPVNVSLNLTIQRQPRGPDSPWIPVLLTAGATNESNKILRINKTHWVAHARSLPRKMRKSLEFIKDVNGQMTLGEGNMSLGDGATSLFQDSRDSWDPIAFGPLFDANEIRPHEKISAQRLVYVPACSKEQQKGDCNPADIYRILRVKVSIPTYPSNTTPGDEDLVRVFGGFLRGGTKYVAVNFCQAERTFRENGVRWWFDKFLLPRVDDSSFFREPSVRYCPTPMSPRELERVGAQTFVSTIEVNMDGNAESQSQDNSSADRQKP